MTEDNALVSILIPCHNAVLYIGAAVQSALAQTWRPLEIIVVDDNSNDGSIGIIESYSDKGIRIIRQHCGSASKARNVAFSYSNGAYVKFFDADDLLSPTMIERQMSRLNGNPYAVASSEWGRFYGDDLATFRLNPETVWRDMKALEWLLESWMSARPMMQPGMFLIPKPLLELAGGWNEELTLIDDFEFFARIISNAYEVLFTPGAVLYYRSGLTDSLSGQKSRRAVESAFHSLMDGTAHLLSKRADQTARQACANILQDFIFTYYPGHSDLRKQVAAKVEELGGSSLLPDGGPRFKFLSFFLSWRGARMVQRFLQQLVEVKSRGRQICC